LFKHLPLGRWLEGGEIELFENEFAEYIGVRNAIAVPSARVGLELILQELGLPSGSRILVPAYTADCIPRSVEAAGFRTEFVEIDTSNDNISIESLKKAVNKDTGAVIATHLFGRSCDIDAIINLALERDFKVIEDYSHSIGATYRDKKLGSFGAAGFCTFSSTKYFNTFGGGMITTDDDALCERLRARVRALPSPKYLKLTYSVAVALALKILTTPSVYTLLVFPFQAALSFFGKDMLAFYNRTIHRMKEPRGVAVRYSNVQAHLGRKILASLDSENNNRITNATLLNKLLDSRIERLLDSPEMRSVYWLYIIHTDDPVAASRHLLRHGIDTGKFFMVNCADPSFSQTERTVNTTLQIPLTSSMKPADIKFIAAAVNSFLERGN
jgi:dTDP-4-amino-4,6-dideoxygalactose transaminase